MTFAATLLEEGRFAAGFTGEADMILEAGIEQSYDEASRVKPREWQVLTPSATAWLLIAGKTIHTHCLRDEVENANGNSIGVKIDVWGSRRRVWSRELWELWKARLQSLADQLDIDEAYRALAARTATKMAKIEDELGGTA
jgi:hypothetical protein